MFFVYDNNARKTSALTRTNYKISMANNDIKRISRITAILIQLQTKRLLTAPELAEKFDVSVRTIYRDIKTLEEAGVPVLTEDGKGYTLMDGYKIPPVMFTETEANALITVEQLVRKNKDRSLIKAYTEAISKIKAVLQYAAKNKAELLSKRIAVKPSVQHEKVTDILTAVQNALASLQVLRISYHSEYKDETTHRTIEPFALYNDLEESWTLIAYCRLRREYRMFRLDRILRIEYLEENFKQHKLTLEEFLSHKKKNFYTPDIPLS